MSRRIYAIGDVHGCADQLAALQALILEDQACGAVEAASPEVPLLVHLGDYVDRGPDSAGVVARLLAGLPGFEMVNLMGNHERTMLDALAGDGGAATDWLHFGGVAALQSWNIDPASPRAGWASLLPPAHLTWLRGLRRCFAVDGFIFVHAGLRPGVPLAQQSEADLLSIRMPFLYSDADFGAVVVHGHTPTAEPVVRHNRIGIDTGAAFGGKLTCVVLGEAAPRFLQV